MDVCMNFLTINGWHQLMETKKSRVISLVGLIAEGRKRHQQVGQCRVSLEFQNFIDLFQWLRSTYGKRDPNLRKTL